MRSIQVIKDKNGEYHTLLQTHEIIISLFFFWLLPLIVIWGLIKRCRKRSIKITQREYLINKMEHIK